MLGKDILGFETWCMRMSEMSMLVDPRDAKCWSQIDIRV